MPSRSAMIRAGSWAANWLTNSTGAPSRCGVTSSAVISRATGRMASISLKAKARDTGIRRRRWVSPLANSITAEMNSKIGPSKMPCIILVSVSICRVASEVTRSRWWWRSAMTMPMGVRAMGAWLRRSRSTAWLSGLFSRAEKSISGASERGFRADRVSVMGRGPWCRGGRGGGTLAEGVGT